MSDVINRARKERDLARAIANEFARFHADIETAIAQMSGPSALPPEMWQTHQDNLTNIMGQDMARLAITQAGDMLDEYTYLGADWGLVNERAAAWARTYTNDLVYGIRRTSERVAGQLIGDYFEQGMTQEQLRARLLSSFGPRRAEMIAITEVTRAAAEGERVIEQELARQGITATPIWQTSNDDMVCPVCRPRHNRPIINDQRPPAHQRCRCWITHRITQ